MIFLRALNDPLLRVAFLCILLMGPAVASVAPFQSVIAIERLGFGNAVYAFVVTAGAFFSVIASVVIGIIVDQTQRYRAILLACICVGIAAGFLMAAWPTAAAFVLVHMVLFPIAATTFTQYFALAAVAADRNPRIDKDVGLSLVRAGFAGTFAITPPLWALALARGADLLAVYWTLAVANVLVLVVVYLMWPKDMGDTGDGSGLTFWEAVGEVVARAVLIRLGLITAVTSANGLYSILLGLLVVTQLGGQESDIGWFSGGVAMVELPVMLGGALLLKRFSRVAVILGGAAIYALSFAALAVVPNMAAAWWLVLPFGIGAGIILSVPVGYIQSLVEHRPGAGSALISMSHFGGTLVASGLFAGFAEIIGYSGVAVLGAALSLGAAALLYLLEGGRMRPRAV
ncbi:MFS transporter [Shimia isoporae]|uniref:MFS transporter n=1 Tax=Shimia isoporae TaxID=647720 RepID=A0A4R1N2J3_9RHOB|nr:MFS transporter [Shimia isoporae]TCL00529.1 MFS transporter [Shimia isoporae]